MATTGTTATTSQTKELWVGIIGDSHAINWNAPSDSFSEVSDHLNTTISLAFEERIVSATGAATTSASHSAIPLTGWWVGAIATFKDAEGDASRRIFNIA